MAKNEYKNADDYAQKRKSLLAKVHIAKKELGLGEGEYRDFIFSITKKYSSSHLNNKELLSLLEAFTKAGWQEKKKQKAKTKPHIAKIYALWGAMERDGILKEPTKAALRSFVKRQTISEFNPQGISAVEFLNPEQANLVIEGLKAWKKREAITKNKKGEVK